MQSKTKALVPVLAAALALLALPGCSKKPAEPSDPVDIEEIYDDRTPKPIAAIEGAMVSFLIDKGSLDEVCSIMEGAGLNTEDFKVAVKNYNSIKGIATYLPAEWTETDFLQAAYSECSEAWNAAPTDSDGNSRLMAQLLLKDVLKHGNLKDEYNGNILMQDLEVIETSQMYSKLDSKLFTTLFGETPIETDLAAAYQKNWNDAGFTIENKAVSLLSIVFDSTLDNSAFVGHAGVLINFADGVLFVEKLDFSQPYVAIKARDRESIIKILEPRSTYDVSSDARNPVIFENGIFVKEFEVDRS